MSSATSRMQTTSFTEKLFFLAFPKNSLTKSELLSKNKLREVDGQHRETVKREKVLWVGQGQEAELRPKPLARRPAGARIIILVVPELQTFSALLQVRKQGGFFFFNLLGIPVVPMKEGRNG